MTSNAIFKEKSMGFIKNDGEKDRSNIIRKGLSEFFPIEFLNRIDEIVLFNSLNKDDIKNILLKNIFKSVKNRFRKEKIHIEFDQLLIEFLVDKGFNNDFGARNLERVFEKEVLSKIVNFLYENDCQNKTLAIKLNGEEIFIKMD